MLPSDQGYVETYLSLARMYARKNEAPAVLHEGLGRHPQDERLTTMIADLEAAK